MKTISLRPLTPELEGPKDLGRESLDSDYEIYFSDEPICVELDELVPQADQDASVIALRKRFALWVVPHSFGVIKRSGLSEPVEVSVALEFSSDGGTCSIVSMFPGPQYIELGTLSVGGDAKIGGRAPFDIASGVLSPNGEMEPGAVGSTGGVTALPSLGVNLGARVDLGIGVSVNVISPIVSAVGVGGRSATWVFCRARESLLGRDIRLLAVIAVSKHSTEIVYTATHSLRRRTAFFSTPRHGVPQKIVCSMQ